MSVVETLLEDITLECRFKHCGLHLGEIRRLDETHNAIVDAIEQGEITADEVQAYWDKHNKQCSLCNEAE